MRYPRYIAYTLGLLLCLAACSGEDCPINNTVAGKMVFYNRLGDPVAINGVLSVSVVRPQGDSIVLNRKSNAAEVTFPLSYTHETDTLIFDYNGGMAYDTLYVSHTNIPTLVSVACGTTMFHTLTKIRSTHHAIDTLIIKSPEVNYDERENIQIICLSAD